MRLIQECGKGLIITRICRDRMNDTKPTARVTVHYCFQLVYITKTVRDMSISAGIHTVRSAGIHTVRREDSCKMHL